MSDIFENDKKFKQAIGAFMIAFSELEYGLAYLGAFTEFDLRKREDYLLKHIGNSFTNKMKNITSYIKNYLPELKDVWDIQKNKIELLNNERRFVAHGIVNYSLPNETIMTYVKNGAKLSSREYDIETIKRLTKELSYLSTGKNGINGEFHTEFAKCRINLWNDLVNDENKIVYRVNSEIISKWKGKNK